MFSKLLVGLLLVAITPVWADEVPDGPAPNGVLTSSLETAPPSLLHTLNGQIGKLVPPGAIFDSTDVVIGRPRGNRRLIFIWNAGRRWIVATEHGGRGYNDPIFAYDLAQDGSSATLVQECIAVPETVCSTAKMLLNLKQSIALNTGC